MTLIGEFQEHKDKCEECKRELPIRDGDMTEVYFGCDQDMGLYCAACWEKHPCNLGEHGEGCMTQIFATGDEG